VNNTNNDNITSPNKKDIARTYLKGHKESVTCLDVIAQRDLLLSGSDDNSVRIWDLTTSKSIKALLAFDSDAPTSITHSSTDDNKIYVSHGTKISTFDLRRPEILLKQAETTYNYCKDEINDIQLFSNDKLNYLISCDDLGTINFYDMKENVINECVGTVKGHANIASTIKLLPAASQVLSGGLDCKVIQWDIQKRRAVHTYNVNEVVTKQLINPPYVHHLSTTNDAKYFAAALGNGSVPVYDTSSYEQLGILEDAHAVVVSHVLFLNDSPQSLLTAGNDGLIKFWKIKYEQKKNIKPVAKNRRKNNNNEEEEKVNDFGMLNLVINHNSKMNTIINNGSNQNEKIFVGDLSNNITCYSING
jgi:WD40 repeat protein